MSWKELSCVVRRLQFVKLAWQAQQPMSQLCRRFGMSRKSGYKWMGRFEREGPRGLRDRQRRPRGSPRRISMVWLKRIRGLRRRHRSWGSRKLERRLRQEHPGRGVPSARTIAKWLKRMKLSVRQRRRYPRGPQLKAGGLTVARRSNQVWTVDFKGWFRTGDGRRVDPLTVRDGFSRYLLSTRLLKDQRWEAVRRICRRLFVRNGYPSAIRCDNGRPFGSKGPAGLTCLSAWWTALGIGVEFIAPGHPEQNGSHEQMHRVLKAETTRRVARHLRAQQRRTDRWVRVYNRIRPHEALKQRAPAEVYRPRPEVERQPVVRYPKQWVVRQVRTNGQIKWQGSRRFVGEAFAGYPVGLKFKGRGKWAVYFCRLRIGELREREAGPMRPARYTRRSR